MNHMNNIINSKPARIALGVIIGLAAVLLIALGVNAATHRPISQDTAKAAALNHAGVNESEVSSLRVAPGQAYGEEVYDVSFTTAQASYRYEIARDNGEVLSSSFDSQSGGTTANTPAAEAAKDQPQTADSVLTDAITEDQARNIALQDAGVSEADATFVRVKQDQEDGVAVYEIEFYAGNTEYDYEIARQDGRIVSRDYDMESARPSATASSETAITLQQAKTIALNRVSGATESDLRIREDMDDGYRVYEGEIRYNGMEYEFTIDAASGNVVEWSAESWD